MAYFSSMWLPRATPEWTCTTLSLMQSRGNVSTPSEGRSLVCSKITSATRMVTTFARGSRSITSLRSATARPCSTSRSIGRRAEHGGLLRSLLQKLPPLLLDRPRLVRRQRRRLRKFFAPRKRPAGIDDRFGVRGDAALLVVRRNARIEGRAPGVAHDVDAFGRLAARRDCPHHVGEVRWIDVVVDHDDDARHVAVRRRDQCRALGVAVVALA